MEAGGKISKNSCESTGRLRSFYHFPIKNKKDCTNLFSYQDSKTSWPSVVDVGHLRILPTKCWTQKPFWTWPTRWPNWRCTHTSSWPMPLSAALALRKIWAQVLFHYIFLDDTKTFSISILSIAGHHKIYRWLRYRDPNMKTSFSIILILCCR